MWVLLFLLTFFAGAQSQPVFPDETQNPKQAGGAELLEAVCPGHVVAGKELECQASCPKESGFPGQDWTLQRVLRGHFRSPASEDAVLAISGCESHADNFGGTVLLTRDSGRWRMLWYKAGVPSAECHRVKLQSGRDILICLGGYGMLRALSVFARQGERTVTPAQVRACQEEQVPGIPHRGLNFNAPTKLYRVDFKFDGKQMVRVGESSDASK